MMKIIKLMFNGYVNNVTIVFIQIMSLGRLIQPKFLAQECLRQIVVSDENVFQLWEGRVEKHQLTRYARNTRRKN